MPGHQASGSRAQVADKDGRWATQRPLHFDADFSAPLEYGYAADGGEGIWIDRLVCC